MAHICVLPLLLREKVPRSSDIPGTPNIMEPRNDVYKQEPAFREETADPRAGVRNIQGDLGTFCCTRKQVLQKERTSERRTESTAWVNLGTVMMKIILTQKNTYCTGFIYMKFYNRQN